MIVSSRNFLIVPLPTTVHSFLCVHIRFRIFRIAIKPIEITIIRYLTYLLHYTWVKWNGFLAHTTFVICSQINLFLIRLALLRGWKLVFCSALRRVYVRRNYSSIAKDLKFNWSIQVMWKRKVYSLVQSSIAKDSKFNWSIQVMWKQKAYWLVQQHKSWQILQLLSFLIPVGTGGLLFWVIIYSYLQKFFKIGVVKNFSLITGKHLWRSFFLIN